MKKILILVMMLLGIVIGGCEKNKYKEYSGTYNLYFMVGDLQLNDFEYYRIILEADGDCIIESKGRGNSQNYRAEATYDINQFQIKIYTKNGNSTITEEYLYTLGEIHMLDQTVGGVNFSAKFRRTS